MLVLGIIFVLLLVCLDLIVAWFVIKLAFFGVLFLIFALIYPEQVFTNSTLCPTCHPGNLTSEPGQLFAFVMLGFLVFCGIMAYRQSKESK